MNIKSLLLGSAAALVAVSGARAADAIVAVEPEPVEYVRVCDAFGTGYFYIPGTETCLRIHGYVRYDINGGDLLGATSVTGDDTWKKRARASVRFSTASQTELGTLRTYVESRWQFDTNRAGIGYDNANEFTLNFAWIQLGGLRIGKDESYFTTFTGYGAGVINDTLTGGYGPFDTNLISYTYNSGNFRAGISFEEGVDSLVLSDWGIDDYMPHVVVGAGATFGMVDLSGVFAYDTRDDFGLFERGGWAAKIRADFQLSDAASLFVMGMYGENTSAYTTWANGVAGDETISVMVGGAYAFSDRATFNFQGQWVEDSAISEDAWSIVANVAYELVPGLTITPELAYASAEGSRFAGGEDEFGGTLRFQRSF